MIITDCFQFKDNLTVLYFLTGIYTNAFAGRVD